MAALTEGKWQLEFLVSEAAGYRSREVQSFGASTSLTPGTVVMVIDPAASNVWVVYADATFVDGTSRIGILGDQVETGVGGSQDAVIITNNAEVTKGELVIPGGEVFATMAPRFEAVHIYARTYGARAS